MTTNTEFTQLAVLAAFKRTELQRFPSPIPGWEIVQLLAESPRVWPPTGITIRILRSGTSCEAT
jgi:hypothetical protein